MQDAAKSVAVKAKVLRSQGAALAEPAGEANGDSTAAVLAGLQALLAAKLRHMQAGMVGERGHVGGLPLVNNQYQTGMGNVLSLS
jgi:hypothetical protein